MRLSMAAATSAGESILPRSEMRPAVVPEGRIDGTGDNRSDFDTNARTSAAITFVRPKCAEFEAV